MVDAFTHFTGMHEDTVLDNRYSSGLLSESSFVIHRLVLVGSLVGTFDRRGLAYDSIMFPINKPTFLYMRIETTNRPA